MSMRDPFGFMAGPSALEQSAHFVLRQRNFYRDRYQRLEGELQVALAEPAGSPARDAALLRMAAIFEEGHPMEVEGVEQ